jgi:cytochrome P450
MLQDLTRIPGPKRTLLVGNLLDFISTPPHIRLCEYGRNYGEITCFWLFNSPNILINEASLIEQVMVTHRNSYYKNAPRKAAEPVIGSSVFLSNDPEWAVKRRNHPFSATGLRDYFAQVWTIIQAQTLTHFQELQHNSSYTDLYETLVRACFSIFGLTILGSAMNDELYRDFGCLMKEMNSRGAQPFALSLSPQFWSSRRQWFDFIDRQIQSKQQQPTEKGLDILSMVIHHYSELPLSVLRDELSTIFTAGTRNVALTVAAVLFLCAKHPEVQQKLQAEIDASTIQLVDVERINQLVYLDQVVKEALRLYPAVPLFIREVLPGQSAELAGYLIPARTQIFISSWAFHRHPKHWQNPDAFIPERFAAEPDPYHYFPFGVGLRECAGKDYTLMCSKVMLFTILSSFLLEIEPTCQFTTTYYSGTIMPKHGLPTLIRQRE